MKSEALATSLVPTVIEALRRVCEQQSLPLPRELSAETCLFGKGGILDSLALVSLVVEVEHAIQDAHGAAVSLSDDRAMSQKHSPFRTIGSLADYASEVIGEEKTA